MYQGACYRRHGLTGVIMGITVGMLLGQMDSAGAQTPVPVFDRQGKPAPVMAAEGRKVQKMRMQKINIRQIRLVRGRVMLLGFDNKERPLPDGLYETTDGKQIGVAGGHIRYIALPATLAAQGRSMASGGQAATARAGRSNARAPAGTTNKASALRGRYRVTINGFTVHHETKDDALQLDGKRDEVYVTARVAVVDKTRRIRRSTVVETKVMGDTNGHSGRVRAGSASRRGGIRTGDDVPAAQPWRMHGAPRGDRLPLAVWEGELVKGENSVVVIPVLWEHDGRKSAYQRWRNSANLRSLTTKEVLRRILTSRNKLLFDLAELKIEARRWLSLTQEILGDKMDRPIGLKKTVQRRSAAGTVRAVTRGHGATTLTFSPKALILNYDTAEFALKDNMGGKGFGVISIRYTDHPDLEGDYTLYLQVQRL